MFSRGALGKVQCGAAHAANQRFGGFNHWQSFVVAGLGIEVEIYD